MPRAHRPPCLCHARTLRDQGRRRGTRHRVRRAVRAHHVGVPQDAAGPPARRQCGHAGRPGTRESAARRAPTSSTRSQCGGRRRGADRYHQSGPRATRLRQRDPGSGRAGRLRKGASVDAIFPGSPFEQRFRDMHTPYQQIRARTDHFAVGAKSYT